MEEIKKFITEFLNAEALALEASAKPDLDDFNTKLNRMNSFCVEPLQNMFGMLPLIKLKPKEFYKRFKSMGPRNIRDIYKISHFLNEIYGDVYVVYFSDTNPNGRIFVYGECMFVATVDNKFKILKKYSFGDQLLVKSKFQHGMGLTDVSFETLGSIIEIERFMPPKHDKDGMEHYNKDI